VPLVALVVVVPVRLVQISRHHQLAQVAMVAMVWLHLLPALVSLALAVVAVVVAQAVRGEQEERAAAETEHHLAQQAERPTQGQVAVARYLGKFREVVLAVLSYFLFQQEHS
jgi:uncharacterized membrane protein